MGYQALLFCADEKSAQLVTQVLTELEFSVEPANEPFAAVKRLTTQHFDAVVVDCENEQNASLLFKSARNSGPNKTSLAVAVVEGQPGIAKAFRIGANLVLTKPINVEQSKGTLRVARGLLKKPEAGKPAAAVATAPVAQAPAAPARPVPNNPAFARPTGLAVPTLKPVVPPKSITTKPAPPAVRAEAPSMLELEAEPIPQTESTDAALLASMPDPVVATPAPPSLTPKAAWPPSKTGNPFSGGSAASGQATGVAPARETAPRALEPKPAAFVPATSEPSRPVAHSHPADTYSSAPILSTPEPSGSGAQKWILIAAAIVLAAVGGYFVSTKMHPGSTAVPVATTPTQPAAAQPAPEQSAPAQDITLGGSSGASNTHPTTPAPATQVAPVNQTTPQEEISDEDSAETLKKPAQKPSTANAEKSTLVVKSSASKLAQAQAEQAPQAIPMTGLASNSGDKALSGILEAGPSARTPVLRTVKVSQGVSQGLVIKKVSPDYPAQARQLRIEGSVQLEATISKDGSVKNLKVVSGHPILARSAMEAVKQWKYKPYLLNGQAVEIDTQIAVNFKLP
jgi:TonB family protein